MAVSWPSGIPLCPGPACEAGSRRLDTSARRISGHGSKKGIFFFNLLPFSCIEDVPSWAKVAGVCTVIDGLQHFHAPLLPTAARTHPMSTLQKVDDASGAYVF